MAEQASWRARPVFVSSTFHDMQAERDWLRSHVFPELDERLRARRAHLEPIDLRWGVETVSVDGEQAKAQGGARPRGVPQRDRAQAGLHISPQDERFLEQLRRKSPNM